MTANDLDLLRQFARDRAQDAFTELVKRHLNLVFSAALRQVRSAAELFFRRLAAAAHFKTSSPTGDVKLMKFRQQDSNVNPTARSRNRMLATEWKHCILNSFACPHSSAKHLRERTQFSLIVLQNELVELSPRDMLES